MAWFPYFKKALINEIQGLQSNFEIGGKAPPGQPCSAVPVMNYNGPCFTLNSNLQPCCTKYYGVLKNAELNLDLFGQIQAHQNGGCQYNFNLAYHLLSFKI